MNELMAIIGYGFLGFVSIYFGKTSGSWLRIFGKFHIWLASVFVLMYLVKILKGA